MNAVVYTMVRDENVFLPIWLKYYSQFFDPQNIYVFNHLSTDGSVDAAEKDFDFHRVDVDHPVYNDFPWYTGFIQDRQREFLADYDVVLFTEADEIVWHETNLGNYIANFTSDAVRTNGYTLWHDQTQEAAIDLSKPILSQREFYSPAKSFCKQLLTRTALKYEFGFHEATPEAEIDPSLYLFHLHYMDFDLALKKHLRVNSYKDYSEKSIEQNLGFQGRLIGEEFTKWFESRVSNKGKQSIPASIRKTEAF